MLYVQSASMALGRSSTTPELRYFSMATRTMISTNSNRSRARSSLTLFCASSACLAARALAASPLTASTSSVASSSSSKFASWNRPSSTLRPMTARGSRPSGSVQNAQTSANSVHVLSLMQKPSPDEHAA